MLRTRRRIADGKPDWALSAAGLAGLRGRGGRGESDENTGDRNEEGDEALSIDDADDEADAATSEPMPSSRPSKYACDLRRLLLQIVHDRPYAPTLTLLLDG